MEAAILSENEGELDAILDRMLVFIKEIRGIDQFFKSMEDNEYLSKTREERILKKKFILFGILKRFDLKKLNDPPYSAKFELFIKIHKKNYIPNREGDDDINNAIQKDVSDCISTYETC